jgi:protoheme IX farnesyltransferase
VKLLLRLIAGPDLMPVFAEFIAALSCLFRVRLATLVATSALCGALLAGQRFNQVALLSALAVWLLAAGCSALNQLQEIDIDARMSRTCRRPLPGGTLMPAQVLRLAVFILALGLLLLLPLGGWPLALGLLAVIWYNLVYTPLKRKTAWAVFPGAVCGALPPLIGYTALGGTVGDPLVVLLAGTLLVWQVPHFWLLAWRYRLDQRASGLPTLFDQLDDQQFFAMNNCWLVALLSCYLCFGFFGLISNLLLTALFLVTLALLTLGVGVQLRRGVKCADSARLFQLVNLSMALLLLVLIVDSLL